MELRVLRYFLIVAREENITHAAELLHVSQPTLSRQLMQLEEELGVKLFQRGKYNVTLTPEGTLFRRRAQEIVDLADKAASEMKQDDMELAGTISIGAGELRSTDELSKMMVDFQSIHSSVKFEIHSAFNPDIKEKIEQGLLDLGLLIEPVELSKYEFVRMKTKERWGVLVKEDSSLADKEYVTSEDLKGIPLMASRNEPSGSEIERWFGSDRMPEVQTKYNLLYNAAVLLREKGGACLCLDLEAKYEGLKFIPLSPSLEFSSVLAWKEHQAYSKATEEFINFVKKYRK